MVRIRRILCPVDFSPASDHAVQYAADLARNFNTSLKLLHVVSTIIPTAYEYSINTADLMKSMEDAAGRQIRKLATKVRKTGLRVETEVKAGDVIGQIKKEIETYKPDLVAMGANGRGLLDRIFLGSTAEKVVRAALCPVMVIPPEKKPSSKMRPRKRAA